MRWYWVRCFRASPLKNSTLRLLNAIVTFTPSSRETRSSGLGRKSGTTFRRPRGSFVYLIFLLIDRVWRWTRLLSIRRQERIAPTLNFESNHNSSATHLLIESSSQRFQSPSLRLTLQPSSLRTLCRLRRFAFLAWAGDALNERSESSEGLLSILLLAPILLGLDGNHALL